MKLRDYQEKAVDGTFAAWERARSALVVLPTGCGKTVVFSEIASEYGIDPFDRFDLVEACAEDPAMIISPTEEVQLRKYLKKEYERTSFARRQALVAEMRRRKRGRIATLGQARYLARHGFVSPLRQDEASRIIERLSKKQGWGWRRDHE